MDWYTEYFSEYLFLKKELLSIANRSISEITDHLEKLSFIIDNNYYVSVSKSEEYKNCIEVYISEKSHNNVNHQSVQKEYYKLKKIVFFIEENSYKLNTYFISTYKNISINNYIIRVELELFKENLLSIQIVEMNFKAINYIAYFNNIQKEYKDEINNSLIELKKSSGCDAAFLYEKNTNCIVQLYNIFEMLQKVNDSSLNERFLKYVIKNEKEFSNEEIENINLCYDCNFSNELKEIKQLLSK